MIGGHGAPCDNVGTWGGDTSVPAAGVPGTIKSRGARRPPSVARDLACPPAAAEHEWPAAAPATTEGGRRPWAGARSGAGEATGWRRGHSDGPRASGRGPFQRGRRLRVSDS